MPIFKRSRLRRPADLESQDYQRRLRILLIDESPTARSLIGRRLSQLDHDVALAENGFVSLNILVTRPADIILIDMGMTMLSGVATMQKIRTSGLADNASFVMIAGRLDATSAVAALEAGADDHIVKPFDFDLLDARLRHQFAKAEKLRALRRHNAELDARIARRAVELGETRDALLAMQADRSRLVSSIQALHDQIERLSAAA